MNFDSKMVGIAKVNTPLYTLFLNSITLKGGGHI